MRTLSNKENVSEDSDGNITGIGDGKVMAYSTVNGIFGVYDELREPNNKRASRIYDVEEEWIIKDLLLWKGQTIPSDFDRDTQRYNDAIVGKCQKCIFFIHEMPFNITSQSIYDAYDAGNTVPRETAKAYLNRYHNYEFQRLFKLWNVRFALGGHKHTAALTGPVYDAPPGYNPLTKQISGAAIHNSFGDDILQDKFNSVNDNGMFDENSSVRPFIQILASDFNADTSNKFSYKTLKQYVREIYNNSSSTLSLDSDAEDISGNGKIYQVNNQKNKPRIRVEVVDSINAPQYIMCQATGFKNKSNSELAALNVPWEDFYVKKNELIKQCYPFFTHYQVSNSEVDVKMYQINDMYSPGKEDSGSAAGYWDLNKIYTQDTLEANRDYYAGEKGKCSIKLFNNKGTEDNPRGTAINLL